uniref:Uncharacterized protein n=1 Tax=Romanomermis culicivorax TaxID=13658 RepID=A0A915K149_ROMCU
MNPSGDVSQAVAPVGQLSTLKRERKVQRKYLKYNNNDVTTYKNIFDGRPRLLFITDTACCGAVMLATMGNCTSSPCNKQFLYKMNDCHLASAFDGQFICPVSLLANSDKTSKNVKLGGGRTASFVCRSP